MSPPKLTIIIPSLAKKRELSLLFESLAHQTYKEKIEILLCTTNPPNDFLTTLNTLPNNFNVKIINSPIKGIARARNLGIHAAQGELILFVDEDCSLPSSHYLQDIRMAYCKNPNYCAGGYYLNTEDLNYFERGYNYICNFWLNRHLYNKDETSILLGGCCAYPLDLLKNTQALFPENLQKSGEEYLFNDLIKKADYKIFIDDRWSVYHRPSLGPISFVMKSWVQGETIGESKKNTWVKNTKTTLIKNPTSLIVYLPLVILYFFVGRVSYFCSRK